MEFFEGGVLPSMVNIIHIFDCPIYSFSNHTHFDQSEVVFVAGGVGVYIIGNETYRVRGGDLLLINKGLVHALESDTQDPLDVWTMSLNRFVIGGIEPGCLLPHGAGPLVRTGDSQCLFRQLFQALLTQSVDQLPGHQEVCRNLCGTICILAHQSIREPAPGGDAGGRSASGSAAEILAYIDASFSRAISLQHLSQRFYMSPGHINHVMATEYGISPIDYVIRKRINAAQWELVMEDTPVKDIAANLGYESIEHFIKQFKKRTGLTPSQYRSKYSEVMMFVRPGGDQD